VPRALGKEHFPLGKGFAECLLTWHSAKPCRQRGLCRVPRGRHSAKVTSAANLTASFAECHDTRQRFFYFFKKILCRVFWRQTLNKDYFLKKKNLCRVPWRQTLDKDLFFLISLPSVGTRQRNGHFTECQPNTRQSWTLLGKMPSFA